MHVEGFTIGGAGLRRKLTGEDLARLEKQLLQAQAHLDEVSAAARVPPPPRDDPRHRTLPEHLAAYEKSQSEDQRKLDAAGAAAAAAAAAISEAARSSPRTACRFREALREAQARVAAAELRVERGRVFNARARARLPEDEHAEALARVADAELRLGLIEMAVNRARGDLLPEPCQDALELLAEHATDEWLDRYGPSDEPRRMFLRPEIAMNIEAQLLSTMFRPRLEGLDWLRNITGTQASASVDQGGSSARGG